MGIGNDKNNYKMMDVTACHLKDSNTDVIIQQEAMTACLTR